MKILQYFRIKEVVSDTCQPSKTPLLCSYLKPEIQEQGTECGELRVGSGERYTPGNVAKNSMECRNKLRRILPNLSRISSPFL